jgi:hypothetical protein
VTTNTAKAVIEKAYVDAGKVQRGGVPTPSQYLDGLDRLNDIINLEQTQGLKLWLETETTVTLVVGQQMYSLYPLGDVAITKPLRVKQVIYVDSYGTARELIPVSRDEWTRLSNRTETGAIHSYFTEKLADRLNVYVWNKPDTTEATGSVKLVLHNQATNPAIVSEETAFPPEWVIFLRWALAEDLSTGMPEVIIQRCAGKAEIYRQKLEGWDVEDAPTYFQPDTQWNTGSRFA